jgi:hypothetical protein
MHDYKLTSKLAQVRDRFEGPLEVLEAKRRAGRSIHLLPNLDTELRSCAIGL